MRDDFDSVVADRFKVLDHVPVPDTWSRVQLKVLDHVPVADTRSPVQFTEEEVATMIDVKILDPTETRQKRPRRALVAGILVAAAVVAIALVATSDGDDVTPTDEPSTTVTVPPTTPRALFGRRGEQFLPGTYFVDNFDGTPTAQFFVTIGAGWTNTDDGWGIGKDGIGYITFSKPDAVFSDACHTNDGYYPGPLTTLDGLAAALSEQGGWVDPAAPSDISVDGYVGKAFQRTAPADFSDCSFSFAQPFSSWENTDESGNRGWSYYEPGEVETLWVLDVDGTVVAINTRLLAGQSAAAHAEFAAVLDSIRIERG
jgi:hypothetical protein